MSRKGKPPRMEAYRFREAEILRHAHSRQLGFRVLLEHAESGRPLEILLPLEEMARLNDAVFGAVEDLERQAPVDPQAN